jgi:pilus assembly protein CpaF
MDRLREANTIDHVLQEFLSAAIRARKSVVISGAQASGKTTFTRALAGEIDPWESVATLETERELYLNELDRPRKVIDIQARPGSGEFGANGRRAGEITQEELLEDSLRLNLDRLIVGEVRGPEAMAMFKAMQSGAGSISTIHAANARDTIERLITCVLSAHSNEAYAARLVASHIDLIVHLSAWADPQTGRRRRVVDEVIEVQSGEGGRPAVNVLFRADAYGRAVPATPPSFLEDLVRAGFDRTLLEHHAGTWTAAPPSDLTQLDLR